MASTIQRMTLIIPSHRSAQIDFHRALHDDRSSVPSFHSTYFLDLISSLAAGVIENVAENANTDVFHAFPSIHLFICIRQRGP